MLVVIGFSQCSFSFIVDRRNFHVPIDIKMEPPRGLGNGIEICCYGALLCKASSSSFLYGQKRRRKNHHA